MIYLKRLIQITLSKFIIHNKNFFSHSTVEELLRQFKKELKADFDENTIKTILNHPNVRRQQGSNRIYKIDLERYLFFPENDKIIQKSITGITKKPSFSDKETIKNQSKDKEKDKSFDGKNIRLNIDKFNLPETKQYWIHKFFAVCVSINLSFESIIENNTVEYGKGNYIIILRFNY